MRHRTAVLFSRPVRISPGTGAVRSRPIHWRSSRWRWSGLETGEYGGQPARNLWIPRRPITSGMNLRSAWGSWIMASSVGIKAEYKLGKMDWRCCFPCGNGFFCTFSYAPAQLQPMEFSEATDDCYPDWERCMVHYASRLMQIFSLRLAQIPTGSNSIELYGYMATRDCRDSKLNYIFNHKRDDAVTVQQGYLIEMTGPKRGICMRASVLLEFDMRIKKIGQEEEDLQLIDGASDFSELTTPCRPCTGRINGDWGAVDITLALLYRAVEATIEVVISDVHSGFSLYLSSFVFMNGLHKEIQLFHGTIVESCCLRRFVIAVNIDTWMHLKLKIGQKSSKNDLERYCSFKASIHGCADQHIIVDLANISANVTWSTVPL